MKKHAVTLKTIYHHAVSDNDDNLLLYLYRQKKYKPAGQILKLKIKRYEKDINNYIFTDFAKAYMAYKEVMKLKIYMGDIT
jgi:hypothetical protein